MQKIIYFSLIDWFFTKQRPQHFAEALSKKYEVHYISIVSWRSKIKNTHTKASSFPAYKKIDNLHIHRLRLLPGGQTRFINFINNYLIQMFLKFSLKYDVNDWLFLTHPSQMKGIKKSKNRIIYDCMDYYEGFIKNKEKKFEYLVLEKELIKRANKIITSSVSLLNLLKEKGAQDITVINNATEFEHFSKFDKIKKVVKKRKIIGYFGGLGHWFDIKTINSLAKIFPNVDFHIIGPQTHKEIFSNIILSKNIFLLGSKPYTEIPDYLNQFDVCLYLFNEDPLVKFVNPVKIYEYLAQGKPVISINNSETEAFGSLIYRGSNLEDHVNNLQIALNETNTKSLKDSRIKFASKNTWSYRCCDIYNFIQ